ncbi:MAG: hypothetical protein H7Z75_13230 [Ferruginibacter sp.]|nr:hypothetical protein [Cytophagales bacterium]
MLALTTFASAQDRANAPDREFKPFKVDVSLGFAVPAGSGSKGGVLFALEPKYAVSDQIAVGLRLEAAAVARAVGDGVSAEVKAIVSYALTGDYYFSTNKSRLFAGLGAGLYQFAAATVTEQDQNQPLDESRIDAYSKFGVVPRVGAELGHFRAGLEYNLVPKMGEVKNSYFAVKLGVLIGGGKYNK